MVRLRANFTFYRLPAAGRHFGICRFWFNAGVPPQLLLTAHRPFFVGSSFPFRQEQGTANEKQISYGARRGTSAT